MNLELGNYDTEDEAAYAYNVGMKLLEPGVSPNSLNHGMKLTKEQMDAIEKTVWENLIRQGWIGR